MEGTGTNSSTGSRPIRHAGAKLRPVAVVTGASSGIGLDLARLFAAGGIDLVLVARSEDRLLRIGGQLRDAHAIDVDPFPLDLSEADAPQALRRRVQDRAAYVEYLVNNAGFGTFGPFAQTTVRETLDLMQVNIHALTHLTALFLPGMLQRDSGRILNVASTAAFQPGPLMATYYASKAYVLHFSEAIAEEVRGSGVSVTALCPGPTTTRFHAAAEMEKSGLVTGLSFMSSAAVARAGYRGMMSGKRIVIPGVINKLLAMSIRAAPRWLVPRVVQWIQKERE